MKLFTRKRNRGAPKQEKASPQLVQAQRYTDSGFGTVPDRITPVEKELYDRLRCAVPIVDAALMRIVRLTGGFKVICSDEAYQDALDNFAENVPVGLTGKSIYTFADSYLDSLLTYGAAAGEIVTDCGSCNIAGLYIGDVSRLSVSEGNSPLSRRYTLHFPDNSSSVIAHPERIIYTELIGGKSLLRGLPALSSILLSIYRCIGQNYDRAGNVRYAVTYKPSDDCGDAVYSRERAVQIAREWADGMNSAKYGQVKDFVAVGDIDIKVIGAENQLFDTNVPVRQLLEQLTAKLSIPPFLLGLNWSSTERMSAQQADILTSELEYYRRLLTPVIRDICNAYLCSVGIDAFCSVEWENINLQDESALADARLRNAQAREIEMRLDSESKN